MSFTNEFDVTGNLVADPTSRIVGANNKVVANFRMAVNESYGGKERKLFLQITAWEANAERVMQDLSKGMEVRVVGHIENNDQTIGDTRTFGFNFVGEFFRYQKR